MFYRDATWVILTYSINDKVSFQELKAYWYSVINKECQANVILCICANKIDLYEMEQVSSKEGKGFAEGINAYFVETSAITKCGIENLFQLSSKLILIKLFLFLMNTLL